MEITFSALDYNTVKGDIAQDFFKEEFLDALSLAGVWAPADGVNPAWGTPEVLNIVAGSTVVFAQVIYPAETVLDKNIWQTLFLYPEEVFNAESMPLFSPFLGNVTSGSVEYSESLKFSVGAPENS
eukprot:gene13440-15882_t